MDVHIWSVGPSFKKCLDFFLFTFEKFCNWQEITQPGGGQACDWESQPPPYSGPGWEPPEMTIVISGKDPFIFHSLLSLLQTS